MKFFGVKLFPSSDLPQVRKYYWLTSLANCWFLTSTWVFFVQRLVSLDKLSWMDASVFGLGLLLEVPTGVVADLFGKAKAIQLAQIFFGLGGLMMSLANGVDWLWFSMALIQVGLAFYSGSVEAFIYDTLKDSGRESEYDQVIAFDLGLVTIVSALATLVGGWLYLQHPGWPIFAWSIANWLGLGVAFGLKEPKMDTVKFSWNKYWQQTQAGTQALLKSHQPMIILLTWLVLGVGFTWEWGILRTVIASYLNMPIMFISALFAILAVLTVITLQFLPWIRTKISDLLLLFLVAGLFVLGYGWLAFHNIYLGILAMLVISISTNVMTPLASIIVNKAVSSQYRATAISTLALGSKSIYVVLTPLVGYAAAAQHLNWYAIGIAAIIFVVMLACAVKNRWSETAIWGNAKNN